MPKDHLAALPAGEPPMPTTIDDRISPVGRDAEDVVQQTYLQAFTKLVDFRGEASLRTWLTRITLNDAIRRRRRQRSIVDLSAIDTAQERARSHISLSPLTLRPRRARLREARFLGYWNRPSTACQHHFAWCSSCATWRR